MTSCPCLTAGNNREGGQWRSRMHLRLFRIAIAKNGKLIPNMVKILIPEYRRAYAHEIGPWQKANSSMSTSATSSRIKRVGSKER